MGSPWDYSDYCPVVTFGFEQITCSSLAMGFTTTYDNAKRAVVDVETNQVRYRLDGTAPTSAVGTLLSVGDQLVLWGTDIQTASFFAVSTNATLSVHYAK